MKSKECHDELAQFHRELCVALDADEDVCIASVPTPTLLLLLESDAVRAASCAYILLYGTRESMNPAESQWESDVAGESLQVTDQTACSTFNASEGRRCAEAADSGASEREQMASRVTRVCETVLRLCSSTANARVEYRTRNSLRAHVRVSRAESASTGTGRNRLMTRKRSQSGMGASREIALDLQDCKALCMLVCQCMRHMRVYERRADRACGMLQQKIDRVHDAVDEMSAELGECPICAETCARVLLPCGHRLCAYCYAQTCASTFSCPLCRHRFRSRPVKLHTQAVGIIAGTWDYDRRFMGAAAVKNRQVRTNNGTVAWICSDNNRRWNYTRVRPSRES